MDNIVILFFISYIYPFRTAIIGQRKTVHTGKKRLDYFIELEISKNVD